MMNLKNLCRTLLALSFLGFVDAAYLAISHFQNRIPPCTTSGCETVLTSQYATIGGIPIALLGALYYLTIFFLVLNGNVRWLVWIVSFGFASSLALIALQLFVIHAICMYCMISASATTLLFIGTLIWRRLGNST